MNISEDSPQSLLKYFPLSNAQLRLLIEHEKSRVKSDFNVSIAIKLPSDCNILRLEQCLKKTIRRHPALRTIIHTSNGERPTQSVVDKVPKLELVVFPALSEIEIIDEIKKIAKYPFDNLDSSLLRIYLISNQSDFLALQIVIHEVVCDGASLRIVLEDLKRFYSEDTEGGNDDVTEADLSYRDYIVSCSERWVNSSECDNQKRFWINKLDGYISEPLLIDKPIRSGQVRRPARKVASINSDQVKIIRKTCARFKKTPFVMIMAAYLLALARRSTLNEFIVSIPISARGNVNLQQTVGCFLNVVPVRIRFDWNNTVSEFIDYVQREVYECIDNAEFPFELFNNDFDGSFFDTIKSKSLFTINSQDLDLRRSLHPGWKLIDLDLFEGKSNFCLYFRTGSENGLLSIEFDANKYECASADGVIEDVLDLLVSMADVAESQLNTVFTNLSNPQDRFQLDAVDKEISTSGLLKKIDEVGSLSSIFDEVALALPEEVALVDGPRVLTYAELRRLSNGMANTLCATKGEKIGIVVSNSFECIIGIISILKAGAAYVPLDPESQGRWETIINNCSILQILVASKELPLINKLVNQELKVHVIISSEEEELEKHITVPNDQIAYVLHTSGSTGVPKGVMQTHRGVAHFIDAYVTNLQIQPRDQVSLLPSLAYDAAVMDLYAALLTGATLHLASVKELGVDAIATWVHEHKITIWHSTPTLLRLIAERVRDITHTKVRTVVFGGEEVSRRDAQLAQRLFGPQCLLVNGYGPTESTVTLQYSISDSSELSSDRFPIGVPVSRTGVIITDPRGIANTLIGELHLESQFIALGYVGQEELTNQRFSFTTKGGGCRRYSTGDFVRIREDGILEFVQREDGTAKIRGNLVSFQEVESWLLASEEVANAVVFNVDDEKDGLIAFVVARNKIQGDITERLHKTLKEHLPNFMIPRRIHLVEEIPVLQNNKIDRVKLLAALVSKKEEVVDKPYKFNKFEREISQLLGGLINETELSVEKNIFDMGASSITVLIATAEINKNYNCNVPIAAFFEKPTIRSFCETYSSFFQE